MRIINHLEKSFITETWLRGGSGGSCCCSSCGCSCSTKQASEEVEPQHVETRQSSSSSSVPDGLHGAADTVVAVEEGHGEDAEHGLSHRVAVTSS